jgi:hypothetical protein
MLKRAAVPFASPSGSRGSGSTSNVRVPFATVPQGLFSVITLSTVLPEFLISRIPEPEPPSIALRMLVASPVRIAVGCEIATIIIRYGFLRFSHGSGHPRLEELPQKNARARCPQITPRSCPPNPRRTGQNNPPPRQIPAWMVALGCIGHCGRDDRLFDPLGAKNGASPTTIRFGL